MSHPQISCILVCLYLGTNISAQTAQSHNDTLFSVLDSVVVTGRKPTSSLRTLQHGALEVNMKLMNNLPKILGNADPIHYTQMLPGVQTNSEYDSGLHVQGCDNSHNFISSGGVPIYNASHLLGFFSTFIPSHHPSFTLSKSAQTADAPNRLGARLDMNLPDSVSVRSYGEAAVGPMSSQGTLHLPVNHRSSLTFSARASYLNMLYSQWLKADESQIKYSFYDINATYTWMADKRNRFWVDLYAGKDDAHMKEMQYLSDISLEWGNYMCAAHWEHRFNGHAKIRQTVYGTHSFNKFRLWQEGLDFSLPSDISDRGYKGKAEIKDWIFGAELAWHNIRPQSPDLQGTYNETEASVERLHTQEHALYADYSFSISPEWNANVGMKATTYITTGHKIYCSADPSVNMTYIPSSTCRLSLNYSWRHQYLFKTGFSSLGLPTEYWTVSTNTCKPQYMQNLSASLSQDLFGTRYTLTVELYYKKMYNTIEYNGNILGFLNEKYTPEGNFLHGDGYNYGINIMLNKRTGRLTGWLSYSYGRAQRRFEEQGYNDVYPANHERPHELNMVGIYNVGTRWQFGMTYVFASGTPFTAPEYFYLVNGNILSQYGKHNANRLKPYSRLDLSANYRISKKQETESGINISLYNALSQSNDIYYRLKFSDNRFAYRPLNFIVKILPSVNYYIKF